MEGLFAQIITKEMAFLAAAAIAFMLFFGKIPLKDSLVNETKVWKSWGIFLLLLLCLGGAFIPGIRPEGEIGNAILFGLVSALAAQVGRKILLPVFLGKLEGKAKKE